MRYDIEVISSSTPDKPATGYGDSIVVRSGSAAIYGGHCSACPNPVRPSDGAPWRQAYGWVALGTYGYEYYNSPKYGPCLLVNKGGKVPGRYDNPNQDSTYHGEPYLNEILVHSGGRGKNPLWRGSAGCITLHPDEWPEFIKIFKPGDWGSIWIHNFAEKESKPMRKKLLKRKVAMKAIEPPAIIGTLSLVGLRILSARGIDIDPEIALPVAAAVYGLYKGLVNLVKHLR